MTALMPTPLSMQFQRLLRAAAAHWAESRRRREDRALLSEMGSRELSDLGLGRGEIDRLAATPASAGRWAD